MQNAKKRVPKKNMVGESEYRIIVRTYANGRVEYEAVKSCEQFSAVRTCSCEWSARKQIKRWRGEEIVSEETIEVTD